MNGKDYLDKSMKSVTKRIEFYNKVSVHCKNCGHTVTVLSVDRIICDWCGYWVYKDDKTEFMYKMMENIRKGSKNNNI